MTGRKLPNKFANLVAVIVSNVKVSRFVQSVRPRKAFLIEKLTNVFVTQQKTGKDLALTKHVFACQIT